MRHGEYPRGHFRENAGLLVVKVLPHRTSQECSNCGHKVKKALSERMHNCPVCHTSLCRDLNAAFKRSLWLINIYCCVGSTPCLKKLSQCLGLPGVAEKPTLYR